MKTEIKYVIIGLFAGIANGFFGSGGGMFLVPLFCKWAKMDEKKAFATSLSVVLPLSLVSAFVYFRKGSLDIATAFPYLAGGLLGGTLGGIVFKKISAKTLRLAFGLFIIYGGIRALFGG